MNKYYLRCTTDNKNEHVIANGKPTKCPTNAAHTIDLESISVVERDVTLLDGTPTELTLNEYKQLKSNAIDARTSELIEQGFSYASKTFSLSGNAQTNILAIFTTRSHAALTYPIAYSTIDDLDSYNIVDATDAENMYLTALATKRGHLDSGNALKDSIRAAVDEAGVDAVVDNR